MIFSSTKTRPIIFITLSILLLSAPVRPMKQRFNNHIQVNTQLTHNIHPFNHVPHSQQLNFQTKVHTTYSPLITTYPVSNHLHTHLHTHVHTHTHNHVHSVIPNTRFTPVSSHQTLFVDHRLKQDTRHYTDYRQQKNSHLYSDSRQAKVNYSKTRVRDDSHLKYSSKPYHFGSSKPLNFENTQPLRLQKHATSNTSYGSKSKSNSKTRNKSQTFTEHSRGAYHHQKNNYATTYNYKPIKPYSYQPLKPSNYEPTTKRSKIFNRYVLAPNKSEITKVWTQPIITFSGCKTSVYKKFKDVSTKSSRLRLFTMRNTRQGLQEKRFYSGVYSSQNKFVHPIYKFYVEQMGNKTIYQSISEVVPAFGGCEINAYYDGKTVTTKLKNDKVTILYEYVPHWLDFVKSHRLAMTDMHFTEMVHQLFWFFKKIFKAGFFMKIFESESVGIKHVNDVNVSLGVVKHIYSRKNVMFVYRHMHNLSEKCDYVTDGQFQSLLAAYYKYNTRKFEHKNEEPIEICKQINVFNIMRLLEVTLYRSSNMTADRNIIFRGCLDEHYDIGYKCPLAILTLLGRDAQKNIVRETENSRYHLSLLKKIRTDLLRYNTASTIKWFNHFIEDLMGVFNMFVAGVNLQERPKNLYTEIKISERKNEIIITHIEQLRIRMHNISLYTEMYNKSIRLRADLLLLKKTAKERDRLMLNQVQALKTEKMSHMFKNKHNYGFTSAQEIRSSIAKHNSPLNDIILKQRDLRSQKEISELVKTNYEDKISDRLVFEMMNRGKKTSEHSVQINQYVTNQRNIEQLTVNLIVQSNEYSREDDKFLQMEHKMERTAMNSIGVQTSPIKKQSTLAPIIELDNHNSEKIHRKKIMIDQSTSMNKNIMRKSKVDESLALNMTGQMSQTHVIDEIPMFRKIDLSPIKQNLSNKSHDFSNQSIELNIVQTISKNHSPITLKNHHSIDINDTINDELIKIDQLNQSNIEQTLVIKTQHSNSKIGNNLVNDTIKDSRLVDQVPLSIDQVLNQNMTQNEQEIANLTVLIGKKSEVLPMDPLNNTILVENELTRDQVKINDNIDYSDQMPVKMVNMIDDKGMEVLSLEINLNMVNPSDFGFESYKKGDEALLRAKVEQHFMEELLKDQTIHDNVIFFRRVLV